MTTPQDHAWRAWGWHAVPVLPTRFCELVGCRLPLQQAGMGGVATPELAAAVAAAGGLGMLPALGASPLVDRMAEAVSAADDGPIGVNILLPFARDEDIEAAGTLSRLVELFWGPPNPATVARAAANGALVAWQVGSVEEAKAAAGAGCHLIIAQGVEAGGHVRGDVGLLPLLAGVLDAVDVPVVAAGGIGGPRSAAAAFAAGAHAVRIGTRMVATRESGAHPDYVAAVCAASPDDTVLTTAFGTGWPDAPHRVLRSAVDALEAGPPAAWRLHDDSPHQLIPTASVSPPTTDIGGQVDGMALYAGQSVAEITTVEPAGDVVRSIIDGARQILGALAG